MSPVRALVISIAWILAGILLRVRFRILGCDRVEGGWALAIYFFLTTVVLLWVHLSELDPKDDDDMTYRRLSRLAGLVSLAIVLSACVQYGNSQEACSS